MKFKINDRIIVREWDEMPESFRKNENGEIAKTRGKCCGKHGVIIDALSSEAKGELYQIYVDDGYESALLYRPEWLKPEPKPNYKFSCRYEAETEKLWLSVDDGAGEEIKSFGFVRSEDLAGYVGAFSWAAKMLYEKIRKEEK